MKTCVPLFSVGLATLAAVAAGCAASRPPGPPGASRVTTLTVRLQPHEDIKQALETLARQHGIEAACVLTCVASLEQAALRFADQPDTTTLTNKFEVTSLSGTLSRHGSHLHAQLADGQGRSVGGHVMEGCRVYTTAEIVLGLLPDVRFTREVQAPYGFHELVIHPRPPVR